MNTLPTSKKIHFSTFLQSAVAADAVPWVPLSSGTSPGAATATDERERPAHAADGQQLPDAKAFKPLRFMAGDRGFVELLRLQPGEAIARHRHTGEVHAFNLRGWRELDSGERIGPGDYVYEAAGNIDSWRAIGAEPLVLLVVVMGAVEYLDSDGNVTSRYTASVLRGIYERHCAASGIAPVDLES